jgi:hypothetical protein
MQTGFLVCYGVIPGGDRGWVHQTPPATTRRVPTGRIMISGPSTSRGRFVCWYVRSTTVRDLRLVVTTVLLREPQVMIRTGYSSLFGLSRDQGQWWCAVASLKPHRAVLLIVRAALAGWRGPTPVTETRSQGGAGVRSCRCECILLLKPGVRRHTGPLSRSAAASRCTWRATLPSGALWASCRSPGRWWR